MHRCGVVGIVDGEARREISGEVDLAAVSKGCASGKNPSSQIRLAVRPSMGLVQLFKSVGSILSVDPSLIGGGHLRLATAEYLLHRFRDYAALRTFAMKANQP